MAGVDALLRVARQGVLAKNIVADLAHKSNLPTQPGGGHRLVGPLAAGEHKKLAPQNGFARLGEAGGFYHHIGIGAAHYQQAGRRGLVGHGASAKQLAEKIAVVFGNGVFAGHLASFGLGIGTSSIFLLFINLLYLIFVSSVICVFLGKLVLLREQHPALFFK
jgi:hypothetical protein